MSKEGATKGLRKCLDFVFYPMAKLERWGIPISKGIALGIVAVTVLPLFIVVHFFKVLATRKVALYPWEETTLRFSADTVVKVTLLVWNWGVVPIVWGLMFFGALGIILFWVRIQLFLVSSPAVALSWFINK